VGEKPKGVAELILLLLIWSIVGEYMIKRLKAILKLWLLGALSKICEVYGELAVSNFVVEFSG